MRYQFENTMSWFIPGKRGDHDLKFGVQAQYSQSQNDTQDNLNGTFTFNNSNATFDASGSAHLSGSLLDPRARRRHQLQQVEVFCGIRAGQVEGDDHLTFTVGARYDLEIIPITETDNPLFADPGDYPVDSNNIQPRFGFAYDMADGLSVVRGGYGRFFDKTHFELIGGIYTGTVFATSFNRNFPLNNADPGPLQGNLPTDPFLVNGPVITPAMLAELARQFPAGTLIRNTGATWDNPDRRLPYTDQVTFGYERQIGGSFSASADYVHTFRGTC